MNEKENLNFSTEAEFKKGIYNLTKNGYKFRDIEKMDVFVNGAKVNLTLSMISKIVNECKMREKMEGEIKLEKKNHDKALLFELFEKDYTPIAAVIETKFHVKFVKETFNEYNELKGMMQIMKSSYNNLLEETSKIMPCKNLEEASYAISLASESHRIYQNFKYPCNICGEEIQADMTEWSSIKELLTKRRWGHESCHKETQEVEDREKGLIENMSSEEFENYLCWTGVKALERR